VVRGHWHAVGRQVFDGTRLVCTVDGQVPFAAEVAHQMARLPELLQHDPEDPASLPAQIKALTQEIHRLEEALVEAETAAEKPR
jgi:hypothetical protein